MNVTKTTALAHSNIALVKYWGKRNTQLNLPAVGSISINLENLHTTTSIEVKEHLKSDELFLNGNPAKKHESERVRSFMDLLRKKSGNKIFTEIISHNNFPTSAGLASSASAFAALSLAASCVFGLQSSKEELSELARQGSGSAARSIYGGFVEMKKGSRHDGIDAVAIQLAPKEHWELRLLIAITSESKKETGSTDGMKLSEKTSPYYKGWVKSSTPDIDEMRSAIYNKDFQKLGELAEFSCLKMHGLVMSSRPGLLYWNGTTIEVIHAIKELRRRGTAVYFTIDAGPQVKAICLPKDTIQIKKELEQIPGVKKIIETPLGGDARIIGGES
ncbi:diphosphomevalonate decarboxylase [candidate division KSB1 bacterium]|nr:diphosphomevalonate decarboxylase [candidate division KSB1 bacterium]MBL7093159.1 diphosphomevalonate decarboxylase [candidate division KSB1 bacterium]